MRGGEACAGFVTVTVESERAVGSVADHRRLSAHERRSPQELVLRKIERTTDVGERDDIDDLKRLPAYCPPSTFSTFVIESLIGF